MSPYYHRGEGVGVGKSVGGSTGWMENPCNFYVDGTWKSLFWFLEVLEFMDGSGGEGPEPSGLGGTSGPWGFLWPQPGCSLYLTLPPAMEGFT